MSHRRSLRLSLLVSLVLFTASACNGALQAPTNLTAVPISGTSLIRLSWSDANKNETGFRIERSTDGTTFAQIATVGTNITTYQDTVIACGARYYYRVRTVGNGNSLSPYSGVASALATDTIPPSQPPSLSALAVSCSQINLSWGASTDACGVATYRLYRNGALWKDVASTSTSDTGRAAATTYTYTVYAVDTSGTLSAGRTASATTLSCATTTSTTTTTTTTTLQPTTTITTTTVLAATTTSTTAAPNPANAALMGFVPGVGPARDVAIDAASGTAYVASDEFGVAVVDVRTPTAPVVLGGADQPFYGDHVAKAGTLAVVGSTYDGFRVVDVTTSSQPHVVGSLTGSIGGVAMVANATAAYARVKVSGNPAHVDLAVIDIRTPSAPKVLTQTYLPGGSNITVVGSYLYVPAGQSGLQIYDLTQPLAPVLRGSVTAASPITAVSAATSGYAYVISGSSILVIDARTPSTPRVVGSYAVYALNIVVSGSRLYAVDGSTLYIFDVTNPAAPTLLSTSSAYSAQAVTANGAMLYLASPNSDRSQNMGGLSIVDATVPSAPVLRGHAFGGLDNKSVAAAGGMAVATGTSANGGLQVVNVQNTAAPRVVGKLAGSFSGVAMASATVAYARIAVTGNPSHVDLAVVDLSTPSSPRIASQTFLPGGKSVAVAGSYLYVGAGQNGLQIYDITSPLAPVLRGSVIPTVGAAGALAVVNGYAYVVGSTSISVIDARTPTSPKVVGSYAAVPFDLAGTGGRLYGVDGSTLYTFGLTNPAAPALLSTSAAYGAQGVTTTGLIAYLAAPSDAFKPDDHALYVIDATNGALPKLVDKIVLAGNARSARVVGSYAYVGDTAGVVDVVRIQ